MKKHKIIEKLIKKLQAGEITPGEFDSLKSLVEKYPDYKEFLDLHRVLSDLRQEFPVAKAERFSQMRSDIMRTIRRQTLQTRSHPVRDMIENNAHQLKADMQQQGLDVDKLEVSVSRDSDESGKNHPAAEDS